jgi:hypothetical protein
MVFYLYLSFLVFMMSTGDIKSIVLILIVCLYLQFLLVLLTCYFLDLDIVRLISNQTKYKVDYEN